MPQFKYHDTAATWNFFIVRIAINPAAVRNGARKSAAYILYFKTVLSSVSSLDSSGYIPVTTVTTPPIRKITMMTSKVLTFSLSNKKAKIMVISGFML